MSRDDEAHHSQARIPYTVYRGEEEGEGDSRRRKTKEKYREEDAQRRKDAKADQTEEKDRERLKNGVCGGGRVCVGRQEDKEPLDRVLVHTRITQVCVAAAVKCASEGV